MDCALVRRNSEYCFQLWIPYHIAMLAFSKPGENTEGFKILILFINDVYKKCSLKWRTILCFRFRENISISTMSFIKLPLRDEIPGNISSSTWIHRLWNRCFRRAVPWWRQPQFICRNQIWIHDDPPYLFEQMFTFFYFLLS